MEEDEEVPEAADVLVVAVLLVEEVIVTEGTSRCSEKTKGKTVKIKKKLFREISQMIHTWCAANFFTLNNKNPQFLPYQADI